MEEREATSPLDAANEVFRGAYADARDAAAREVPVLIVLGDDLVLRHGDQRTAFRYLPALYHRLKAAAHVVVALHSMLYLEAGRALEAATRTRLASLRQHLEDALGALDDGSLVAGAGEARDGDDAIERNLRDLLVPTRALVERALAEGCVARSAIDAHAHAARPVLLRLTGHGAHLGICGLHAKAEEALGALSADERAALQVVVAGDHQARTRSLGMQYFQRRLGESEEAEDRVVYGESVTSEEEAVALVGTRRLDRAIARALFGDARRLQRDVLGDATKAELDELGLAPIL